MEAPIGVELYDASKGKGTIKLFVCASCVYRIVVLLCDRVEQPIHFVFVGGGFGG